MCWKTSLCSSKHEEKYKRIRRNRRANIYIFLIVYVYFFIYLNIIYTLWPYTGGKASFCSCTYSDVGCFGFSCLFVFSPVERQHLKTLFKCISHFLKLLSFYFIIFNYYHYFLNKLSCRFSFQNIILRQFSMSFYFSPALHFGSKCIHLNCQFNSCTVLLQFIFFSGWERYFVN